MKKILLLSAILCVTFGSASAQITNLIIRPKGDPIPSTNDYWLALPSNYWNQNQGGKAIKLYITAPSNCTAVVSLNGAETAVPISAYKISTFNVPLSWEMESSGIVENKGIHVSSSDGAITASFISLNANTSDGSYLIPTLGWRSDYIVAAYGALFEGSGTTVYDFPSECTIVAETDSTHVHIIPTCDCRQSGTGNTNASIVAFPKGKQFSITLNRGQSMQLMSVLPTDADNFDLTGTTIHADHPIGVIGGSMLPNIPANFPYGSFICEMIPPITRWGKTYYAPGVIQPPGMTGHDFTKYLFISSEAGQVIYRQDCQTGNHTECIIQNQYGVYWDELEFAQKFYSSAPFLVVGYINSSTYPDGLNGLGDPSEFTINTLQQFPKTVTFETPQSADNTTPFTNYVNIICNVNDAKNTTFDGKGILSLTSKCIDDTFEVFTVPQSAPGGHVIASDSGVGVYVYGYSYDEAYAWSVPSVPPALHSPDSIPPHVDTSGQCTHAFIHLSDSGFLPDGVDTQSGLGLIALDSDYNMYFIPDPNFMEGSGTDTTGYGMSVLDPTLPAYLQVNVYDLAGNLTTITSIYKPNYVAVEPPLQNLGVWTSGPPHISYDTIYNEGQTTFDLDQISLRYGNLGFSLFDSIGGQVDLSPIPPGRYRLVEIQFKATNQFLSVDSIIVGNACDTTAVAIIGSGGGNDFIVTGQTWPNVQLGNCYPKTVTIENLSGISITIDSVWWADTVHFKLGSSALPGSVNTLPFTVPPSPGKINITIDYCPDSSSMFAHNRTEGNWTSPEVDSADGKKSARFDSLVGWAQAPASVNEENAPSLTAPLIPMDGGRSLEIILPEATNGPVNFELVNVLGQSILRDAFMEGTHSVDASMLPYGVYFYRLSSGGISQSGKIILGE